MRLLTVVLLLVSSLASAQKEGQALIDSLLTQLRHKKADTSKVALLTQLGYNYSYSDPVLGQRYGRQAVGLAKSLNWNDGMAAAYRIIGINLSVDSNYDSALAAYRKGLALRPTDKIRSELLRSIGLVYTYMTEYDKALDYDMQALQLAEKIGDQKGVAAILSNIGVVYYDLQDYRKAAAYYERARKINERMGNRLYLSNNLGNLGNSFMSLKEHDKAVQKYIEAIRINEELGDLENMSINLSALSDAYRETGRYNEAHDANEKALQISLNTGNERNLVFNYLSKGDLLLIDAKGKNLSEKQKLWREADAQYRTSLRYASHLNDKKNLAYIYEALSKVRELQGEHDQALLLYRKYAAYKDSVFNSENKQTIKNLEDKRAIEVRDKQLQVNKVALAAREREQLFLVVGIVLLVTIGGLLFYQSRSRRRTNLKLQSLNAELHEADRVKTRFFSILNHDLRAPVAHLISFLKLQRESPELLDDQSRERMENKTMASAENLLEAMEDMLLWTKGQMENFRPKPRTVILSQLFSEVVAYFDHADIDIKFEHNELSLQTDPDYLKTILRNLTANSIKALGDTQNGTIKWRAFVQNEDICISIADNGPGAPQEQFRALFDEKEVVGIKTGLGMHLIRDLGKAIGCAIAVNSEQGRGTTITLIFRK
ncbi:tetratricopeptide repeat-containing sensor histidine kinase [Flavobacterium selenitireducens]|uniref:tetratricopeptide repeat-containing sensor histidine kinase n=1 Tax=Flavobacterium selenitireducens TaxID=2722704 RepID=UPI00168BD463|nr:tetratricopeptide repeat protein [Flavobacterium selenitireducens]MBD3582013.1 tetratricopeptide repeat protein [Flavobacterium selenitireducens]